ncbi:MAG: DUF5666 domain-containing protein, partial [Gammaproteobacteria bacterium]
IIGSGSPQAIIGSGSPQAIIGSGSPQAIIGSGSPQAIIGSGSPQAIIGSGSPKAIIGSGVELLALGLVEQSDGETITVLGQTIFVTEATRLYAQRPATSGNSRPVAVFGMLKDDGTGIVASDIVILNGRYVEGATPSYLAGYATKGSDAEGVFSVGGIEIVPAAAGSAPSAWAISEGDFVRATGLVLQGRLHAAKLSTD